jgi:phage shock protein PspC (stress-responsive transcriptional regulator)
MRLPSFETSTDERALAGVCAGIARDLDVDVTLVRLVFALLALAGGAGILLYLALWAWSKSRPWWAIIMVIIAGFLILDAVGLSDRAVWGIVLVAAGLALAWIRGGSFRADVPLSYGGIALAAVGAILLLMGGDAPTHLLAPGAVAGGLLLIGGPWLWRLALERDAERSARIRTEERADVAARVHDSVLQTLALIQRHAQEPRSRGDRNASSAAGSTATTSSKARRSSMRCRRRRPTSRSCRASVSSSRAPAMRRSTTRSSSPRARQ